MYTLLIPVFVAQILGDEFADENEQLKWYLQYRLILLDSSSILLA